MDDPSFFEEDLDEEKAKRSILVTDVPENVSPKDVVIHFQKGSNGGGEVVNIEDHGTEHRSSVVITFEHPSIVEKAIKCRHVIKEKEVTVHRYLIETRIPEIFSHVDARINRDLFDVFGSDSSLKQVLRSLRREFGIGCYKNEYGYVIFGSYKQITLCRKSILDEIRNGKTTQQMPPESAHDDIAAEAASLEGRGANSRSTGTNDDNKIDDMIFQSVPIILQFIFTVSKYAKRIQDIESEFNVRIGGDEYDSKVVIRPLPGCTQRKHDDACEEYIKLYREVYDGPMMSKDILLRPGNGTFYSAEDVVKQVLEKIPIAIQKMDEQDKWLFYGEDTDVRSAISEVCKILNIDNPLRKSRKAKVVHVPDKEQNDAGAAYRHMPLGNDKEVEDAWKENPSNIMSPIRKDFPDDKEESFVIETKKGFRLKVYQGDITQEHVDIIVNSTNEIPSFATGLPAAFVKRGGRTIQEEAEKKWKTRKVWRPGDIITTGAGRLQCSKILHILTEKNPTSKKDNEEFKNVVKESCLKCLKRTQGEKLKSIAFPAVGSGVQGISLDNCARAMVNAVEEYMKAYNPKNGGVTDIRFVHLDPRAVEIFKAELTKRYGDSVLVHAGSSLVSHKKTDKKEEEKDDCPICLEGFHDPTVLSKCKHKFCKKCIDQAFQHRKVCPTCGMTYGMQTGNMPPGTMNQYLEHYSHIPGYERYGTIRIDYYFPSGTQGPEHPNPGQRYTGTSRTAFLPDCPEGRDVLDLLRKAFNARLTFTIGRSVTTGASNVVTWNDIHHKTNTHGGATGFGYPDPTYLKRVKDELAAKGIS